MWFSIGISEVVTVGALLILATILAVIRQKAWRWFLVGSVCASVATVLSPADPVSTILLGAVFFLFFIGGLRFGRNRSVASV